MDGRRSFTSSTEISSYASISFVAARNFTDGEVA
jgi:hypothetical protein